MKQSTDTSGRKLARRFAVPSLVGAMLGTTMSLLAPTAAFAGGTGGTQLYLESFQNKTVTSPISRPASPTDATPAAPANTACLTANTDTGAAPIPGCNITPNANSGVYDADGSGSMRLTPNVGNQLGGAFYQSSVSSTSGSGLDLGFNIYQYGSNTDGPNAQSPGYKPPADGLSFALAAVDPNLAAAPTSLGNYGGNLGFNGHSAVPSPTGSGLAYGYLGIGFDLHGNYSNKSFNATGCATPTWANPAGGQHYFPQAVTVRGPGNGTTGYCLLNSTLDASNGSNSGLPSVFFNDGTFVAADGAAGGFPTLNSATASFSTADEGAPVMETDGQGIIYDNGATVTKYSTIVKVVSATKAILSSAPPGAVDHAAADINFYISRTRLYAGLHFATAGTTTNGSTTITGTFDKGISGGLTSADVGATIADSGGAIPNNAYITAVNSPTSATISTAATAPVTGTDRIYVARTRRAGVTATPVQVVINTTGASRQNDAATAASLGLTQVSIPAKSYGVVFKPAGGSQQVLVGPLPSTSNLDAGYSTDLVNNIPNSWINPGTNLPYQLSFGWTASTGANNAIQELNLTSAHSVGGAPPVYTLTTTDRGSTPNVSTDFNGNFSGDAPRNLTSGNIYFDGGLSSVGDDETLTPILEMTTSPGLEITKSATGTNWTCPASKIGVIYTTGATAGTTGTPSNQLTVTGSTLTTRDVGKTLIGLDASNAIPSGATVTGVNNATHVITMSATTTVTASNIKFAVGAVDSYATGSTTNGSATLTAGGGTFLSTDVGALVVETDLQGAVVSQTTIQTYTSATQVTLSKNAAATAAGITFNILRPSSTDRS